MDEEEIIKVLESVGLHRNEIIIYIDLIRVGKSSAIEISKRTKIHRPNVYDTVEKLIEKGIVTQSVKDNKKVFYPIEPKDLLHYHKQKEYYLKEIIPKIEQIQNKPFETRRVVMFEGLSSVRNILSRLLELKEPIYEYGIPSEKPDLLGGLLIDFHNKRIEKKIPMKLIYNMNSQKRIKELNGLEFTEARFLTSEYDSNISTIICGNIIAFVYWEEPMSTIIIESESLGKIYQKYFNILWESAKITYE